MNILQLENTDDHFSSEETTEDFVKVKKTEDYIFYQWRNEQSVHCTT